MDLTPIEGYDDWKLDDGFPGYGSEPDEPEDTEEYPDE